MSTTTQTPDESLVALTANAMRKAAVAGAVSSEGFLLVDSLMNPIYVSQEVAQILMYPQKVGAQKNLGDYLARQLHSLRFSEQSSGTSTTVVARFQSGKRQYLCRAFQVNGLGKGDCKEVVALLFERGAGKSISLAGLSERFRLTTREREVAQHLLLGLTSKEIGIRMKISPNTVKAFIRLIMFKMGVSTRSGIVVKALSPTIHVMGNES
jgi:DNA-binding CsgD family transcriptional regulator